MLYPDSDIPMDEKIGLGNMIWSYCKVMCKLHIQPYTRKARL